jgi:hypothetical protein
MTRERDGEEQRQPQARQLYTGRLAVVRWAVVVGMLAGCGRFGFDDRADARGDGVGSDGSPDAGVPGSRAWFPFEDTTTTGYGDAMGGPPGTCTPPSCPTAAPGRHGRGVHFDGVDDCIAVPDTRGVFSTQAITLAIWAQQDPGATAATSQFSMRADPSGNVRNAWQMEDYYMDGTLAFTSNHDSPNNVQALSAPGAIINGQWQHLAISWDGATKRLYVDGVSVASMAVAQPIFYDGHDAWIGCDDNIGISEVYLGTLDDFVVYDRALTDAEVALLATL